MTYIAARVPDYSVDGIQLNKNLVCKPHVDRRNTHRSYVLFLGDFEGGELFFEDGSVVCEKNMLHGIDGQVKHWNGPITRGTKYSIVWYQLALRGSP